MGPNWFLRLVKTPPEYFPAELAELNWWSLVQMMRACGDACLSDDGTECMSKYQFLWCTFYRSFVFMLFVLKNVRQNINIYLSPLHHLVSWRAPWKCVFGGFSFCWKCTCDFKSLYLGSAKRADGRWSKQICAWPSQISPKLVPATNEDQGLLVVNSSTVI